MSAEKQSNLRQDQQAFNSICQEKGLNALLARDVMYFRAKGHGSGQISRMLRVPQPTISKYESTFRDMKNEEFALLMTLCCSQYDDKGPGHE